MVSNTLRWKSVRLRKSPEWAWSSISGRWWAARTIGYRRRYVSSASCGGDGSWGRWSAWNRSEVLAPQERWTRGGGAVSTHVPASVTDGGSDERDRRQH